jgi:adenine-specific DNA methylase
MANRTRSHSSAALSSSVWLVCRKRSKTARPGWDNRVLAEMREKMTERLRDFWDAGIRGPDFVWAATGPALEAYSKHPVVKKADQPGEVMSVKEFLTHVRRFVVDFQVGRVLSQNGETQQVGELDNPTTYYLLHRNDFGMDSAPAGAVILYALSCGVSDNALSGKYDIVSKSGSKYRLKPWDKRTGKYLGYRPVGNGNIPMVDMVHRLMHLWKAGDVQEVNRYMEERGLRHNELFGRVFQAIIELADEGSKERSMLESISNHLKNGTTRRKDSSTVSQTGFGWAEACPSFGEVDKNEETM